MRVSSPMYVFICLLLSMPFTNASTIDPAPQVVHVGLVAPDILGITIREGAVVYGQQQPYESIDGDSILEENFPHRWLIRDEKVLGAIAGHDRDILFELDTVIPGGLDVSYIQNEAAYSIYSSDDANYTSATSPLEVYRKTKPHDKGRVDAWEFAAAYTHTVYLHLPHPLTQGRKYHLSFRGLPFTPVEFTMDSTQLRSEAIHVTQIGFRPDDTAKVAFLSCWLGDGGKLSYPESTQYQVMATDSQEVVFEGQFTLSKAAEDTTEDAYDRNYNITDIYMADFSSLSQPGEYLIVVPSIGCSHPFMIHSDVWEKPFITSARGLYHQRSGMALGPPYTDFVRPRNYHPDDGLIIYASTAQLIDTGNGPLGYEVEKTNFHNLVQGKTDITIQGAWGGYHDAGDWDRRIQHLNATRYLLDLALLYPDFFDTLSLHIPESNSTVPDIIEEALFGLDVYRRLQTEEGGIRGGIETEEHPRYGELSWQDSLTVMAYAPGVWSSYWYAGTAARAAHVLMPYDRDRALVYRVSAERAMDWAEKELKKQPGALSSTGRTILNIGSTLAVVLIAGWLFLQYSPKLQNSRRVFLQAICLLAIPFAMWRCTIALADGSYPPALRRVHLIRDARNYAAAEMFRLTGDTYWQDIFMSTTKIDSDQATLFEWRSHDQAEAAWVFARTNQKDMDRALKTRCVNAIIHEAEERLEAGEATGFRWIKYPWRPFGLGCPSTPDALAVLRAHVLTEKTRYLRGMLLAAQFGAGANPMNMTMTTGVGLEYPKHPLHLDSRLSGQAAPPGITVLGPIDVTSSWFDDWGNILLRPHVYPALETWPSVESYMDVFWNAPICEFTIHDTIAPNLLYWGYFAARPPENHKD